MSKYLDAVILDSYLACKSLSLFVNTVYLATGIYIKCIYIYCMNTAPPSTTPFPFTPLYAVGCCIYIKMSPLIVYKYHNGAETRIGIFTISRMVIGERNIFWEGSYGDSDIIFRLRFSIFMLFFTSKDYISIELFSK